MAGSLLVAGASESTQRVHLHPLVLLTATDLITRHRLRQLEGPVVGLLLGRQEGGTEITAEYAFTAKIKDGQLDNTNNWTNSRIEQYKEVHKNPVLEVVGWFTLCPEDGPLPEHVAIHKQVTEYSDNAIMLAIHAAEFKNIDGTKGKLPVSIFEAATEIENTTNDGAMQIDGKETAGLRFRPVPYVVDTEESEMIAINYVAKGAGSAAAVSQPLDATTKKAGETSSAAVQTQAEDKEVAAQKGPVLTPDEEDQLAGMTTRLNSVRMLQQRLQLMSKLVASAPPSYISDQTVPLSASSPRPEYTAQLRNIQALLSRLSLLKPAGQNESEALQEANRAQSNDVALTSILSMLGQEVQGLSELGRKFAVVEQSKNSKNKSKPGFNQAAFGGDDFGSRTGLINDSGLMM